MSEEARDLTKLVTDAIHEEMRRIDWERDNVTQLEQSILAFERQWWKYAGAKEQAIRELFEMSPTRYYQTLNALLDKPAAMEFDPMLVKRLRRMRVSRAQARAHRRNGRDG